MSERWGSRSGLPRALTGREAQILGYIARGLSTKEVAYELGISDSTVRVLYARAAGKLGGGRRDQVLARYRALYGAASAG